MGEFADVGTGAERFAPLARHHDGAHSLVARDVAAGERYGNRNRGLSNVNRYATLALAYRLAARELGEIPQLVQAVVWVRQVDQNGR